MNHCIQFWNILHSKNVIHTISFPSAFVLIHDHNIWIGWKTRSFLSVNIDWIKFNNLFQFMLIANQIRFFYLCSWFSDIGVSLSSVTWVDIVASWFKIQSCSFHDFVISANAFEFSCKFYICSIKMRKKSIKRNFTLLNPSESLFKVQICFAI